MSQLKITEMPTASSVNLSDYVPIVQEGINKKVSVEALVGDEADRVEAENKRVQAEASRVAAEKSRVQFEEQRKRDENIRIENYESIIALKTEIEQKLQNGDFIGERGPKGDIGATPNIQIGTVTTLEPDQSPTVERVGTNENPVLNFGIPKGKNIELTVENGILSINII